MINFTVYGTPVPQGRPRFGRGQTKAGKQFVTVRDPATSKSWKETVKWQAIENRANLVLKGPLRMTLVFRLPRPKGHTGKRGLLPSAPVHHTVKPDTDNLVKGVKDALEGICYERDQQVVHLDARKEYAPDGFSLGVVIQIEEIE